MSGGRAVPPGGERDAMNTRVCESFILRTWEIGESDLLVSFLTVDQGRLKGVAKGARRSRRRFSNCLDLFSLTRLEYETKRNRELHFLHSGKLLHAFPLVRKDYGRLALASYMVELIEALFPQVVDETRVFELLKRCLYGLDRGEPTGVLRILFEARAMVLGGYAIDFDTCCCCRRPYAGEGRAVFEPEKGGISCLGCRTETVRTPGFGPRAARLLRGLQSGSWGGEECPEVTGEVLGEIRAALDLHLACRVGRPLKTAAYLP